MRSQNKWFLLLTSLGTYILLGVVKLPGRWGEIIKLLNTTCSCTLRTGLTSGNSPLLLFQPGFLVTEAGDHQGVSKLEEWTKIDSFALHLPGKRTDLNMREVIPIFCCYKLCSKSDAIWCLFEYPADGVKQFEESLCYHLNEAQKGSFWASWLRMKSGKYLL